MSEQLKLAKLHLIQSLFGLGSEESQIATETVIAIDYAITGNLELTADLDLFTEKARQLAAESPPITHDSGFYHLDLRSTTFDPLWVHSAVRQAMKKLAGYPCSILLVTGLRDALGKEGQYWTRRLKREHKEAMETIDSIASQWNTPSTRLHILYL